MAKASKRIWAEVSGIPSDKRGRRLLMVLQAFIDDSGSAPNQGICVLGGFIAPAERWAQFADEWDAELKRAPGADYFKLFEADKLEGQFARSKGWTEELRDERIAALCRLIYHNSIMRVHAAIRHEDFEKHLRTLPSFGHRRLASDHPYLTVYSRLLAVVSAVAPLFGVEEKCDFYFDEQGTFAKEALGQWNNFERINAKYAEQHGSALISTMPRFVSDKDFVPLQAADLYAGSLRKMFLQFPAIYELDRIPLASSVITEQDAIASRKHLLATAERMMEANPALTPVHYDHGRRFAARRPPQQKGQGKPRTKKPPAKD